MNTCDRNSMCVPHKASGVCMGLGTECVEHVCTPHTLMCFLGWSPRRSVRPSSPTLTGSISRRPLEWQVSPLGLRLGPWRSTPSVTVQHLSAFFSRQHHLTPCSANLLMAGQRNARTKENLCKMDGPGQGTETW